MFYNFDDAESHHPITTIGDLINHLQAYDPNTPLRIFIDASHDCDYTSYVGYDYSFETTDDKDEITLLVKAEIPFAKYVFNTGDKEVTVYARDYGIACMRALQSLTTGESGDQRIMTTDEVTQQAQGDDIVALW